MRLVKWVGNFFRNNVCVGYCEDLLGVWLVVIVFGKLVVVICSWVGVFCGCEWGVD